MFRQQRTGGIAGGREAARATAPHLTARSPPAMSPKVTREEPQAPRVFGQTSHSLSRPHLLDGEAEGTAQSIHAWSRFC